MFDTLAERLEEAWKKLRGQGKITQSNIKEALQDVRRALLEADVNIQVVKTFIAEVEKKALGAEVIKGVNPYQQFIKIVYDELVRVMGESNAPLAKADKPPTIILMAGLQGAGKTTATAKLALYLQKQKRSCLMVAADVYRPAAVEQLITLGQQISVPVFHLEIKPPLLPNPVEIAVKGVEEGKKQGVDTVIIDTAGRLQIDEEMMAELEEIKKAVNPHEILLVVDAMTGQEAANVTRAFHERVGITGAILTKMDGDSRGGAALSIRSVSGQPIKFIGVGEKVEALEPFYPDRMASRILNMGDIVTLVEKAQEALDLADVEKMQAKILEARFDFNDFLKQMRLLKTMGSFASVMKLIPGMNKLGADILEKGELQLKRIEAMINSMTKEERANPQLLAQSPSRRRRVAKGSGVDEKEVSRLISDFTRMRSMMQRMSMGAPPMAGMPGFPGMGSLFGGKAATATPAKKPKKQKKKKGFADL